MWGEGKREDMGKRGEQDAAARRPKVQGFTEMVGLYREEQPDLWAQEFRVEGGVCQPYPITSRNREDLALRSAPMTLNRHLSHLPQV